MLGFHSLQEVVCAVAACVLGSERCFMPGGWVDYLDIHASEWSCSHGVPAAEVAAHNGNLKIAFSLVVTVKTVADQVAFEQDVTHIPLASFSTVDILTFWSCPLVTLHPLHLSCSFTLCNPHHSMTQLSQLPFTAHLACSS